MGNTQKNTGTPNRTTHNTSGKSSQYNFSSEATKVYAVNTGPKTSGNKKSSAKK